MNRLRVLHVPTDCGNQSPILARKERLLGFDSWAIALNQSYLGFKIDEGIACRGRKDLILTEFRRWNIIKRALKYDIIVYNYGSSLMPNPVFVGFGQYSHLLRMIYTFYAIVFDMLDVRLFKLLGKKIIVIFQGGDARQEWGALDAKYQPRGYYNPLMDALKRRRIRKWAKLADKIYFLNPDLSRFLPKNAEFMPYVCIEEV